MPPPASPVLESLLAALGVPSEGLPGILVPTSVDRFELLQTPGLWGHDPSDNSYWRAADGTPAPLPAASRRLVEAIEEVVAGAESLLDIAGLQSFASGGFAAAIRRGLARAATRTNEPLTVRILYGRHGFVRPGFPLETDADFDAFVSSLAADVPRDASVRVHGCFMKTCTRMPSPSWNHAKIVAADGNRAIVGGHNLWHDDYLSLAPVHDLSALIAGQAANEAHVFLDHLWHWAGRQFSSPSDDASVHTIQWTSDRVVPAAPPDRTPQPPVCPGAFAALAVGRLGLGVIPDPRAANVGAAVAALAIRRARHSIRISQMDFGFHWEGVNHWCDDVVAAIADVLTDPERRVEVSLVLSELGAAVAAGGTYSFGTTPADIVARVRQAIAGRPVTGRMQLAPLRFAPHGDRWRHDGREFKIANHAKLWMVDDHLFHVGSDNLYPHSLQEFGYVIDSGELARDVLATYWEPLWRASSRVAIDVG